MANEYAFSGPGDVTRVTGDNTSPISREANAEAKRIETSIQPVLRHGYSETVDTEYEHEYPY